MQGLPGGVPEPCLSTSPAFAMHFSLEEVISKPGFVAVLWVAPCCQQFDAAVQWESLIAAAREEQLLLLNSKNSTK